MKAYNFYLATKVDEKNREEIEKYSNLIGKKVKAVSTKETSEDQELEEGVFTIVGLTTKQYSSKIQAVLKSEEEPIVVCVEVDYIGKKRKDFFYNPGYILELLE